MAGDSTADQLDGLMETQARTIRWYLGYTISLFVIGLLVLCAMFAFGKFFPSELLKTMLGLGGGFVASISILPLKEVNAARDRLTVYRKLRFTLGSCPDAEKKKIDTLVWDVIRKIAIG